MYLFYLGGKLLPVTPAKITTKVGNSNKVMELANEGEINLIKYPKLTEYSFDFELPFNKLPYSARECDPKEILDMLEDAKLNKKILTFQIVRTMYNTSRFPTEQQVSVEDYEIEEDANNNSDMTVSITLKKFRAYRTQHIIDEKEDNREDNKNKKQSVACLKKLELLSDLNVRSGAGKHNRILAVMLKGDKPVAYRAFDHEGTTWYSIKHSAGDKDKAGVGWGWISGNPKLTKVLKDFLKSDLSTEDILSNKGKDDAKPNIHGTQVR